MTTLEIVKAELESKGVQTTGIYSTVPNMTLSLIERILHFGSESALSGSRLGNVVKEVASDLAKKDGRKSVICQTTFKNILV